MVCSVVRAAREGDVGASGVQARRATIAAGSHPQRAQQRHRRRHPVSHRGSRTLHPFNRHAAMSPLWRSAGLVGRRGRQVAVQGSLGDAGLGGDRAEADQAPITRPAAGRRSGGTRRTWDDETQRYNFQFTGRRFYRIENGKLDDHRWNGGPGRAWPAAHLPVVHPAAGATRRAGGVPADLHLDIGAVGQPLCQLPRDPAAAGRTSPGRGPLPGRGGGNDSEEDEQGAPGLVAVSKGDPGELGPGPFGPASQGVPVELVTALRDQDPAGGGVVAGGPASAAGTAAPNTPGWPPAAAPAGPTPADRATPDPAGHQSKSGRPP